jgi:hypothetical protein
MAVKQTAPGKVLRISRRAYRHGRRRTVSFRVTDEELELLREAGERYGLTATGFAAVSALDAAKAANDPERKRRPVPDYELLRRAVVEVQLGTNQVNRAGVNLNQAVAKFNTEGVAPGWLLDAAAKVVAAVDRQDGMVSELAGRIREALR